MIHENDEPSNDLLETTVVHSAMQDGQMGVGIWDMKNDTFELMEQITNYPNGSFQSLPDFIDKVVLEKDRKLAHHDLQEYLDEKQDMYRSTFRIQTKEGQYKWLLFKGRIANNDRAGSQRFDLLVHDVSGRNYSAGNDSETKLLTRDFFIRKLKRLHEEEDTAIRFTLLGVTISNYQSILDVYGYKVSMKLIQEVADILHQLLGKNSEIAAFSHDNFVALVYTTPHIRSTVNQIIETFKTPLVIDNQTIALEVNLGVTFSPEHSSDAMEILLFLETATYQARQLGKYQTVYFNQRLSKSIHQRYLIKTELSNALKEEEFYLVYQPQVDARTRQIVGGEARTRWENAKRGNVRPDVFILIAENRGYMLELGHFILEESIRTASRWQKEGYNFGTMSINLSPAELSTVSYIDNILHLCEKYDLPKSRLNLEITEGLYIESIENSLGTVRKLVDAGFNISVDDFGTGYSNLAFLAKAKIDTLKIDKNLIDALDDKRGRILVKSIIDLGQNLGYKVLAEGVETEEQLHILNELDCNLIQGYYFSRPKNHGEMEALLKSGNTI